MRSNKCTRRTSMESSRRLHHVMRLAQTTLSVAFREGEVEDQNETEGTSKGRSVIDAAIHEGKEKDVGKDQME